MGVRPACLRIGPMNRLPAAVALPLSPNPVGRASAKLDRMRVSAKSDYALRALIELAARDDGTPMSAEEIGRR